jgi:hypothetical protein
MLGAMKRLALAVLLSSTFAYTSRGAHAETKSEKTARLAVTVPDGWKLAVKDAGLTGESKDKEVALLAWSVDTTDATASQKKLEGELYTAVASVTWDKPTTGKVHGMVATYLTGTGHAIGGDVVIKAVAVGPGASKKSLLVAAAVKVDKLGAHKTEIQTILDSVQSGK